MLSSKAQDALRKAQSGDIKQLKDGIHELNREAAKAKALFGRTGRIWRGLRQLGWYNLVWVLGIVMVAVIASFALPWIVKEFGEDLGGTASTLAAVLVSAAAWLRIGVKKASAVIGVIESAQAKLEASLAESVPPPSTEESKLASDLSNLENQIEIAAKQVEHAAARAEAAEAELVEVERSASLAHFIEERAASGDYREQLGILALIRRDFEQMSIRMRAMRENPPPLDDASRIDRIVLYIDDLDRCPPERVFEVLQAIHLLLAFDLFVVVVGVDERWLMRALALARAGLLARQGGSSQDLEKALEVVGFDFADTASPADFLEKIFQVPFWLQPIDEKGFGRLVDTMVARDQALSLAATGAAAAAGAAPGDAAGATRSTPGSDGDGSDASGSSDGVGGDKDIGVGNEPEDNRDITSARPEAVAISPREASVMRKLSDVVGRSPRTVKRFVNLYRVLKAREFVASALTPLRESETLGGMLLLALIAGHPRGTRRLLEEIETAPEEKGVTDFFGWNEEQRQSEGGLAVLDEVLPKEILPTLARTAKEHLGDLMMFHLQRWLPTVRRFSFRAEIARGASYTDVFSRTESQPTAEGAAKK